MRLPRLFVDMALDGGQRISLPPASFAYLIQVLRLRTGDELLLFNGSGQDFPARVVMAHRQGAEVRLGAPGPPEPPLALRVHLGLGISKGDRMDYALQKAVELGVAAITPLFTGRGVVRLEAQRLDKRHDHWRGVVIAACEQSGRRRPPPLQAAMDLSAWLAQDHPCPLLLDHRASQSLPSLAPPGPALTLLIGPEGGLAPPERDQALQAGFRGVRLGPRILRSETAPLAALAIAQALWGDLRD